VYEGQHRVFERTGRKIKVDKDALLILRQQIVVLRMAVFDLQ